MKLILSAFVLLIVACSAKTQQKLHVGIYYESLCPDSQKFIRTQLVPRYDAMKDNVEILFVPFGKARSYDDGRRFTCQHGPKECEINRIQSCSLNELKDSQDLQVKYVGCQMERGADPTGETCAKLVGINFEKVMTCFNGDVGRDLQLEAEELTKQISPSFIPTIVLDHKFDQAKQTASLQDFLAVVNQSLQNQ